MWILGLKGLIGELHERERSPVAKKSGYISIQEILVTIRPYVHPAARLSKIILSFPSLGQTELTNEKLSIEDKRFNART